MIHDTFTTVSHALLRRHIATFLNPTAHPTQFGSLPKRTTLHGTLLLTSALHYSQSLKRTTTFTFIDVTDAFYSLARTTT
eukprot:7592865-Alexandrium_andersonii.AAC.1